MSSFDFKNVSKKLQQYLSEVKYSTQTQKKLKLESDTETSYAPPIWILGVMYTHDTLFLAGSDTSSQFSNCEGSSLMDDISSKFYFSYRKDFPPIRTADDVFSSENNDKFHPTSDSGWGCVIRSTQMFLAQTFTLLLLGRNWRTNSGKNASGKYNRDVGLYSHILNWFLDMPGLPFSLHTFCELTANELYEQNWRPGKWLGPSTAANIIKHAVQLSNCSNISGLTLSDLRVYVARDALIDSSEIYRTKASANDPVIVMLPLRLGTSKFNDEYKDCVLKCFCFDNFLGIIGGHPKKCYYIFGAQGSNLIALDPHFCQEASHSTAHIRLSSYHTTKPITFSISDLDPTMSLGFFFKTKSDFDEFQNFTEASRIFYRNTGKSKHCPMVAFGKRELSGIGEFNDENDTCVITKSETSITRTRNADSESYVIL